LTVRRKALAAPSNDRHHPALGSVLAFPATMASSIAKSTRRRS